MPHLAGLQRPGQIGRHRASLQIGRSFGQSLPQFCVVELLAQSAQLRLGLGERGHGLLPIDARLFQCGQGLIERSLQGRLLLGGQAVVSGDLGRQLLQRLRLLGDGFDHGALFQQDRLLGVGQPEQDDQQGQSGQHRQPVSRLYFQGKIARCVNGGGGMGGVPQLSYGDLFIDDKPPGLDLDGGRHALAQVELPVGEARLVGWRPPAQHDNQPGERQPNEGQRHGQQPQLAPRQQRPRPAEQRRAQHEQQPGQQPARNTA